MSSGSTRCHNNPIELVFLNYFLYPLLSILRTSKEISFSIDHIGQCLSKFSDIRDIYIPANIDSAVADEDPNSWLFSLHIFLWRVHFFFGQSLPCRSQKSRNLTRSTTRLHHCLGNVLRCRKGSTDEYSGL